MDPSDMVSVVPGSSAAIEDGVRPTGPGAPCWCGCKEAIPTGIKPTARFVPGHKDSFHNRRRAARVDQHDGLATGPPSPTDTGLSLAEAGEAAVEALVNLGRLAGAAADEVVRARCDAVEAEAEAVRLRAQVQDLTAELAARPGAGEVQVTGSGAPSRPGGSEETMTIARALMVAVRAERARASAAETQAAALLTQLNRTLERLIDGRPTLSSAGVVAAAPARDAEHPDVTTKAVPFRSRPAHRWSVTVPVTSVSDVGEFGSLERLDDDGLLTADEAAALATATAMEVVRTFGPTNELPGILAGAIRPHGLDAEANQAVDRHWRTLDRLARQGLSELVGPIVEGAVSYCGADDLEDDPS